jgi:DNA repair protein REV1
MHLVNTTTCDSVGEARRLCPNLITIPYEFEKYHAVSLKFFEIIIKYADELQAVSIDDALMEVGRTVREDFGGDAEEFARHLRKEIKDETRCDASIGISKNILLARSVVDDRLSQIVTDV